MMMRRMLTGLMMGWALLLTIGSAAAAPAGPPEPLILTYIRPNADYWDITVAIEKGFFADEGFKPEYVANAGSVQSTQLLLTQSVQLAVAQPESLISAIGRGSKDLAAIAAPMRRVDWMLVGHKGMKSIAELKGKTIGFSGLRVTEFWLTQDILQQQGLPVSAYDGVQIGTSVAKYAALSNGSIAAAILFQPLASQAVHAGYSRLYDLGKHQDFIPGVYVVSRRWAAENDHGKRLTKALEKAHAWLYDPKNKAEAIAILKKASQSSDAALEEVYNLYFVDPQWYTKGCEIDTAAMSTALKTLVKHNELAPGQIPELRDIFLPVDLGGRHT
jgi:NitT/TauT family transport system substrate-binding protein